MKVYVLAFIACVATSLVAEGLGFSPWGSGAAGLVSAIAVLTIAEHKPPTDPDGDAGQ